jgi:hypothetical protein
MFFQNKINYHPQCSINEKQHLKLNFTRTFIQQFASIPKVLTPSASFHGSNGITCEAQVLLHIASAALQRWSRDLPRLTAWLDVTRHEDLRSMLIQKGDMKEMYMEEHNELCLYWVRFFLPLQPSSNLGKSSLIRGVWSIH